MPVTIVRDAANGRSLPLSSSATAGRMYLYSETARIILPIPWAPSAIDYGGLESDWVTADRPGDVPLLLLKGRKLKTLAFSFLLADAQQMHTSQRTSVDLLQQLADTRERVMVRYGPQEAGLWRITDVSVSSEMRHPDTNDITRAMCSVTLTRASDAAPAVGPLTGGAKPHPAPKPKAKKRAPRRYKVVKGDCLWKIALRYYGKGSLWPRIFDANRKQIRNPNLIYPGQVFVIP